MQNFIGNSHMQSSGAWDAKVEFRDIKSTLDLKLRGKHFCTNLTSKGQRGVFLSLYHQENYVRIQPAGKYAQTIWGWYSGSHQHSLVLKFSLASLV